VNRPPVKVGTSIADLTAGLFTLSGIAAALYQREHSGVGQKVDVAMFDGQLAMLESAVMRYLATGVAPGPLGNRHPSIAPFEVYDAADRPLVVAAGNDALFARLCAALGRPELAGDAHFASNPERVRHADALQAELEGVLRTAPAAHWVSVLEAVGVPCALVQTTADAVEHPQTRARNMIVTAGPLRLPGNPIKLSGSADPPERRPAPELDADGARIREEFGEG
jgi:CoA:oxalate CoA-transferase